MLMEATERGGKKWKNMIRDYSEAKQQLTEWVEKIKEGKDKESSSPSHLFWFRHLYLEGRKGFGGFWHV